MNPRPVKSEKVRWIERKEGAILLDPDKGIYHKLNSTASYVWRSSDGTRTAGEIASLIARAYSVDKETAKRDTTHLVDYLRRLNIISLIRDPKKDKDA